MTKTKKISDFSRILFFAGILTALFLLFLLLFSFRNTSPADTFDPAEIPTGRVVIVDAGHGGADGGAVARDGTPEKIFTLDLSERLCVFLQILGRTPVMTRTADEDTDGDPTRFDKRGDILARKALADRYPGSPFVSVHINLSRSPNDRGFQIFYGTVSPSSELYAASVQSTVAKTGLCTRIREVKKAPSTVWLQHHVASPCVLAEYGFLSNDEDLARLKQEEYRDALMFATAIGITRAEESPHPTPETPPV